jgi:hypothetical protein
MNDLSPSDLRRKEIEAWWALIARILAFFLGAVILAYQTFSSTNDGVVLILVSAGLMGPMVAAGVAQVLASWRGGAT